MKTSELQKIIRAAELVNSNLSLNEVLKNIVTVALELTNADRGTLYLVDKNKDEIWSLIATGSDILEIRLKMGEGLAGYVAKYGQTINIKDVKTDSRFNSAYDNLSGYQTKSMICFPIKNIEEEIVGVLQLLNNRDGEFTNRDEKFLAALSIHSAIAINNALMLRKQIELNEELTKAKQEAQKFAMLRSHFLTQMSHEIRTPLNIIFGGIQYLKLKTDPLQLDEFSEIFDMLESGSRRITRTIDSIVEMSEIKSGSYEINFELINLENDILQPVIKNYQETAIEKGMVLIFRKTTDENLISKDKFMLYQIFTEIIDNAIKFTDMGTVLITQSMNSEEKLSVSVKDTGIGISTEYLENLFDPFTQEQTGISRKYEGNGLALALVKKYAELNNLSIFVQSEKNVGTELTVVFN
jgi:signal transduction histidine kinase